MGSWIRRFCELFRRRGQEEEVAGFQEYYGMLMEIESEEKEMMGVLL